MLESEKSSLRDLLKSSNVFTFVSVNAFPITATEIYESCGSLGLYEIFHFVYKLQ